MKQIKWAVIGAGNIAKQFVAELIKQPFTCVVGVAANRQQSAQSFAQQFNIEQVYVSAEDLIQHCLADIVYIATPHQLHFEQALSCLQSGKAVLCEKPMTLNAQQSAQLIELALQKKLFLMEAMITPLLPAIQKVQQLISDGDLGEIRSIQVGMGFNAEPDMNSRVFNPALAGGALLDVGIYPLTFAQLMMKQSPISVVSQVTKAATGVDQQSTISMSYESGTLVTCSSSVVNYLPCTATIYGSKLIAELVDFSWSGLQIILKSHRGEVVNTINDKQAENAYFIEAKHVNECLRQGLLESPLVPHQQTLSVLKVMDKLREDWSLVYPDE